MLHPNSRGLSNELVIPETMIGSGLSSSNRFLRPIPMDEIESEDEPRSSFRSVASQNPLANQALTPQRQGNSSSGKIENSAHLGHELHDG
jgi:hypothetical protein